MGSAQDHQTAPNSSGADDTVIVLDVPPPPPRPGESAPVPSAVVATDALASLASFNADDLLAGFGLNETPAPSAPVVTVDDLLADFDDAPIPDPTGDLLAGFDDEPAPDPFEVDDILGDYDKDVTDPVVADELLVGFDDEPGAAPAPPASEFLVPWEIADAAPEPAATAATPDADDTWVALPAPPPPTELDPDDPDARAPRPSPVPVRVLAAVSVVVVVLLGSFTVLRVRSASSETAAPGSRPTGTRVTNNEDTTPDTTAAADTTAPSTTTVDSTAAPPESAPPEETMVPSVDPTTGAVTPGWPTQTAGTPTVKNPSAPPTTKAIVPYPSLGSPSTPAPTSGGGGGSPATPAPTIAKPSVSIDASTFEITLNVKIRTTGATSCELFVNGGTRGGVDCNTAQTGVSYYANFDVMVRASNAGGFTDSNVVHINMGAAPSISATVGRGLWKGWGATTGWPNWSVFTGANYTTTQKPGVREGQVVTILCQRWGKPYKSPSGRDVSLYDYIKTPAGGYGWVLDSFTNTTPYEQGDDRLTVFCPPGV